MTIKEFKTIFVYTELTWYQRKLYQDRMFAKLIKKKK